MDESKCRVCLDKEAVSASFLANGLHHSAFRFFIESRCSGPEAETVLNKIANGAGKTVAVAANGTQVISPPSNPPVPTASAFNALIVEDNIINQTVLHRQLTKAGWTCEGRFDL